jgi:hypothetical protein
VYKEEWKLEDERENLTDLKRIGTVCLTAMNSVAEDMEFTVETEEDFANKRLQTLDFEAWFDVQEGVVKHDFFEKPMRTSLVVMERSAMGLQQKHSILANDLVRRLSNLSGTMTTNDNLEVINNYTIKLKTSGYSQVQAREIIVSGIRGFKKKIERRKRAGEKFYRDAKKTLSSRVRKKLTEKTNWYKNYRDRDDGEMEKSKDEENMRRGRGKRKFDSDHVLKRVEEGRQLEHRKAW